MMNTFALKFVFKISKQKKENMNAKSNSSNFSDITLRQAAGIAGLGYLMVFAVSILANSFSLGKLIVLGDVTATTSNIVENEALFRFGIAGWLIVIIFDAIVAWALYILLKPVNKSLSLLTAWFRLMFVVIFGVSIINQFSVLELVNGSKYLAVFETRQLHAHAMELLYRHDFGVHVAFIFFGIHIFFLGYLTFNSGYIPKILGIMLMVTSIGYLIDSFGNFISPGYANSEILFTIFVAVPGVISEFSLTLWLLIRGVKIHPQTVTNSINQ